MKLLIASDLHGSAYYCEKLLEAFQREEADKILFLGDILYHGPRNDLPEGYDTKKTAAMLNAWKNKIFCVRGNCDTEVDQMVLQFPVLADYAVLQAGDRLIYATHGHVHNMQNVTRRTGTFIICRMCLFCSRGTSCCTGIPMCRRGRLSVITTCI